MTKVALLYAAGTNCDQETAWAFELSGAKVDYLHINRAKAKPALLRNYQILVIPGGFTYGDYIAAGRILANELRSRLREELERFFRDGKLMLGVCNGFQVMVKAGILPGNNGYFSGQTTTLEFNDSHRFEDRWVYLQPSSNKCVFTTGIERMIYLPVAHAEGKFVAGSGKTLRTIVSSGQAVVRYVHPEGKEPVYPWNPNGSEHDIAGLCDPTGRIFGLMPHPERFIFPTQHPRWARNAGVRGQRSGVGDKGIPDGLLMYRNAVNYAKANL
jgi:phosphoribosylformylglycinamidine synthase